MLYSQEMGFKDSMALLKSNNISPAGCMLFYTAVSPAAKACICLW